LAGSGIAVQRIGMNGKVSAIVIHEHGKPARVAKYEQVDLAPPGPGEAQVRVLFAPINPADVNVLEGKYPVRPDLPGVPGVEGVAVVAATGAGVANVEKGAVVLLPHRFGSWRAAGNANAAELVVVPAGVPVEQAAMLRINPATALCMLREFATLAPGDWILQNAANSAVGRCVIQLARYFGWRTVNVVRREELAEELHAIGADAVVVDGADAGREIQAITGTRPARLALNAVGGDNAVRMAGALAQGGTIVTYGAMAKQPLRIPNGMLIFQDIAWRGFWVTRWYENAGEAKKAALLAELFALCARGVLATPIEATYPLAEIAAALAHSQRPARGGKVLLRCSA
jgi:mitochondrial enoyl-[acyl-carrier protein] reductase / trans-2-enoyl-CoA reductase